ncbi:MAG TPA: lipase maturation factor family protein [Bryobacteraceae bacterium]|nr:lipase maturation factor family protein [Bryobacteraceae bacterium]
MRRDGSVASGARAVFESLGRHKLYESSRPLALLSEASYRFIARHRNLFYWITRLAFGTRIEPERFAIAQWIFLRLLAAVYVVAFVSLAVQALGLMGSRGIQPVGDFLARLSADFGPIRYLALPSVFWLAATDRILEGAALAGIAFGVLAFFGRLERLALAACWALYLSFCSVAQEFLSFQWDSLLLEAGFLAIFFGCSRSGQRAIAWLYRWLAFRLYFLSGYVKLGSRDPSWRNLTALQYHFHTQPLPTVLAWYADKLPPAMLRAATFATLAIELVAPFLIFAPRRLRHAGAFSTLLLQLLILLTGNYAFFNVLTMAVTLFLFDDHALNWARAFVRPPKAPPASRPARLGLALLTALLLALGATRIFETVEGGAPEPLHSLGRALAPFQIVNPYGLFAVMTTTRTEIIVEGSDDGERWQAYQFRYKPGPLDRAPRWVQPHQPRLDWQMWFAALGNYRSNPWFVGLALRLLQGSPDVLGLLERNPFSGRRPMYVRAEAYDYRFTDWQTRRRTGNWWERRPLGEYLPAIGLREAPLKAGGTP